ncbi:MAG: hypothetical protein ACW99Q_01075, partial [Candidatus Kariarchaeaceae archaeon]
MTEGSPSTAMSIALLKKINSLSDFKAFIDEVTKKGIQEFLKEYEVLLKQIREESNFLETPFMIVRLRLYLKLGMINEAVKQSILLKANFQSRSTIQASGVWYLCYLYTINILNRQNAKLDDAVKGFKNIIENYDHISDLDRSLIFTDLGIT